MALRNIIKIDEDKCNGCGKCVNACAEGAIELVDGKAKLISEVYCDGLGACIGDCPQDAITIEQREAVEFDEQATKEHLAEKKIRRGGFTCPGLISRELGKRKVSVESGNSTEAPSRLTNWPIQLSLVSAGAPCFADADLLLAADCTAFAMGDFHNKFIKNRSVVIGCPKLDDTQRYIEKLTEILKNNNINTLTIVHMEVPCCSALTHIAKEAIAGSGVKIPFEDVTIALQGEVIKTEKIE